jgi:hypothetical protein
VLDADGPAIVLGETRVPLSSYAASAHINFRSDKRPIRVVSAVDVIRGTVDRSVLADKLVFVGITDPAAGADFFTTPVRSQFPGVEVWATAALDILQRSWVRWGGGVWQGLNWAIVLLLFPGLALVIPGDRKLVATMTGVVLFGASIGVSAVLFGHMNYFWNPANHLYAWVFSLLWLAAMKANPVLAESAAPVMAEPPAQAESDIRPPPAKEQLLRAIPRNETATFVIRSLVPEAATGTHVKISARVFEQFRTLSGGTMIQTLGSGGMADVYLIWNPRLEVYRAVKVIKPGQNPQLMERFETEIRIFLSSTIPIS